MSEREKSVIIASTRISRGGPAAEHQLEIVCVTPEKLPLTVRYRLTADHAASTRAALHAVGWTGSLRDLAAQPLALRGRKVTLVEETWVGRGGQPRFAWKIDVPIDGSALDELDRLIATGEVPPPEEAE